jgi:LacI family transcriptional regulator
MKKPTIRSLAAALGLSRSTVSAALLRRSNIPEETQERVRRAAEEAGYSADARLSQLMSYMRSGKGSRDLPNLAWIYWHHQPSDYEQVPWAAGYVKGARKRAEVLGYSLDMIPVHSSALPHQRINPVLKARGIEGLIFAHYPWPGVMESSIPWNEFASASVEGTMKGPGLPHVGTHGVFGIEVIFENLLRLGYRRPGMFIGSWVNWMNGYQWTAGFFQHQHQLLPEDRLPILDDGSAESLRSWMKLYRPDVVICASNVVVDGLASLGYSVPQDVAVVHFNVCSDVEGWAGLDQLHEEIGAASVEIVTAQLNRNERGLSDHPKHVYIRGRWVDGWTCPAKSPPACAVKGKRKK